MSRAMHQTRVMRQLPAALLIGVLALTAGVAGLHSHGAATGSDAVSASEAPACHACALGHAPAAPPIAAVGIALSVPVIEPITDAADTVPAGFVDRPAKGRAPPAC